MENDKPVKVAIVDDDESVRDSLLGLGESVGYDVSAFRSAEEFLEINDLKQFACLILDVRLPGMSGLDLYCRLGALRQRVPTVFITAHIDQLAQTLALAQGAEAFLYKPFKPEALLSVMRVAVTKSNFS